MFLVLVFLVKVLQKKSNIYFGAKPPAPQYYNVARLRDNLWKLALRGHLNTMSDAGFELTTVGSRVRRLRPLGHRSSPVICNFKSVPLVLIKLKTYSSIRKCPPEFISEYTPFRKVWVHFNAVFKE